MPKLNIKEAEVMDLYITRLVADKGLRDEDRAQHGKISHQLQLEFEEACQKALIDALPDDKAIELNKKLTADPNFSDAEIEEFFATALPNSEQVIIDTMTKFRAEYLGNGAKATPNMTSEQNNTATVPPVGNPVQGTISAQPGASNVEGVANAATAVQSDLNAMPIASQGLASAAQPANAPTIATQPAIATSQNSVTTTEEKM